MAKTLPKGHIHALCYASGEVVFRRTVPAGTLPLASGPEEALRSEMEAACRHSHDGRTLLVPGVPEAKDQEEGLAAVQRFCSWRAKSPKQGITYAMGGA